MVLIYLTLFTVTRLQREKADRMRILFHQWRQRMVLFLVVGSTTAPVWKINLKPLFVKFGYASRCSMPNDLMNWCWPFLEAHWLWSELQLVVPVIVVKWQCASYLSWT